MAQNVQSHKDVPFDWGLENEKLKSHPICPRTLKIWPQFWWNLVCRCKFWWLQE